MPIRLALTMLCLAAAPALAQTTPPAPNVATTPLPAPSYATVEVKLVTSEGPITLALEKERAPVTTANFLRYVDAKRLDGIAFYRAMTLGPGVGLVQGGVRDPKFLFPAIAHEPTSKTGLRHVDGTLSMARGAPGTARADFFITLGALPSLDADPSAPGDNQGFAAFGHVVQGMEVVRRILAAPTSPTLGEGVMRGQMLAPQIRILTARRVR